MLRKLLVLHVTSDILYLYCSKGIYIIEIDSKLFTSLTSYGNVYEILCHLCMLRGATIFMNK